MPPKSIPIPQPPSQTVNPYNSPPTSVDNHGPDAQTTHSDSPLQIFDRGVAEGCDSHSKRGDEDDKTPKELLREIVDTCVLFKAEQDERSDDQSDASSSPISFIRARFAASLRLLNTSAAAVLAVGTADGFSSISILNVLLPLT